MRNLLQLAVIVAALRVAHAQSIPSSIDPASLGIRPIAPIDGQRGRTVALDFPAAGDRETFERLPLARAVTDFRIAVDGKGAFFVLAGGVDEDLDLYRFDPLTRAIDRFPTSGGRRLPSGFADGLGSWPIESGSGLYLFAFERDGEIRFRAQTSYRVVAERRLPIECRGFRSSFDPVSHLVAVQFDGPIEAPLGRMEFLHPKAPRLGLVGARDRRIDFGELTLGAKATRTIELRNDGDHTLPLSIALEGPFTASETLPFPIDIPPDGTRSLEVGFEATAVGVARGRVVVKSPVAGSSLELAVIANVATPAKAEVREVEGAVEVGEAAVTPAAPAVAAPPVPLGPEVVTIPRLDPERAPRFRWIDARRVRIDVRLEAGSTPRPVLFRNARTGASVATRIGSGASLVTAVVDAQAGDPVAIAFAPTAPATPIGVVPSALRVEGGELVIIAPPRSLFLLVRVTRGSARPRLHGRGPLARGRVGAEGMVRVATDAVGDAVETTQVALVLVEPAVDLGAGGPRVAASVEIGPSRPPIGLDRTK